MCKPHRCPHIAMTGNICVYCPGGPDSDFDYSTQSYTGYEPTSMRAIRARYDPYEQTKGRVEQLRSLGHSVDKVEFIVMGGTFMSMPEEYRNKFIAQLHNALSGYTGQDVDEAVRYDTNRLPDMYTNPYLIGFLNRASPRRSVSPSRPVQTTASDRTYHKCSGTDARASKSGFNQSTRMSHEIQIGATPYAPFQNPSTSQRTQVSKSSRT